jgi:hypothetical protein
MKRVRLIVSFVVLFAVFATVQAFVTPSTFADVSLEEGGRCDCTFDDRWGVTRWESGVAYCAEENCWVPMLD